MYTITDDRRWLVRDSDEFHIDIAELDGPGRYTSSEPGPEFIDKALRNKQEGAGLSCDFGENGRPVALLLTRPVLLERPGLELKPLRLALRPNPGLSLRSIIGDLVGAVRDARSRTQTIRRENLEAAIANKQMEEEQNVILGRVHALLEDRNTWLQKLAPAKD